MPTINKPQKTETTPYKHEARVNSMKYYNSKAWKTLREAYIMNHPLCEICITKGISRQAEDVHHVIPFFTGQSEDEKWSLLLDPSNLQSLCSHCHHEVHKKNVK